ncbi:hypothetical protein [Malaciobacter canalis]|uniref:hypothetical protein n=1 Tax=Malaciobacter canalis TaxID=1912871 RepID=UPI00384D059D
MKLPKNRIKTTFLREVKTEALLVFIRTTLSNYFKYILEDREIEPLLGTKEEVSKVNNHLKELYENLENTIVDSKYLQTLTSLAEKKIIYRKMLKHEEPLCVYYDAIVNELSIRLENGTKWIPELLVISLLTEWLIEEEKGTSLFPYIKKSEYLELFNIFEKIRVENRGNKKAEVIKQMYKISSKIINRLKNTSYKVKQRTSKTRKKRKKK